MLSDLSTSPKPRYSKNAWLEGLAGPDTKELNGLVAANEADAGFSLVEVLAALAIISVVVTLALSLVSTTLDRITASRELAAAVTRAQNLLARLGTEIPIRSGVIDGSSEPRWSLRMTAYGDPIQVGDGWVQAYRVDVEVATGEGASPRVITLQSLRLSKVERSR